MAFCLCLSQIELNLFCLVFYFSQSNLNNRILTFICEDVEQKNTMWKYSVMAAYVGVMLIV